jgi:CheY-like chemotaxis protein
LIEDDLLVCQVFEAMLRAEGAAVRAFADPRECLEGVGDEIPNIVITDLSLPDMDGYALLHELRLRLGVRVPALATSAAPTARVQERCFAAGFDRLLAKPFRRSDLTHAVRMLVGR